MENPEAAQALETALATSGNATIDVAGTAVPITRAMVSYVLSEKTETTEPFIPSVIEPSFGIGRIMTGILEHCFNVRDGGDGRRRVLSFPAAIAPVKVRRNPHRLLKVALVSARACACRQTHTH